MNRSIKVTQYSCNFPNLAPLGCTQYFFGTQNGVLESYNYNGGNGHQALTFLYFQIFLKK